MQPKTHGLFVLALALGVLSACNKKDDKTASPRPGEEPAEDLIDDCRVRGECEVAPDLDRTVATTLWEAAAYLIEGENPLQRDVAEDTLRKDHIAIVTGRVEDAAGDPLLGVRVSFVGHPEFGWTYSRQDGQFDLAVNGGARLAVQFEKQRHLPMQRSVHPAWNRYETVPTLALVEQAPSATSVTANSSGRQFAEASEVEDDFGSHQPLILFEAGTVATAHLPDGDTSPLSDFRVRVTEYPFYISDDDEEEDYSKFAAGTPTSAGLTWGISLSVDEAQNMGARSVSFSKPVTIFVENFLGMSVGSEVPFNYYEPSHGTWEQEAPLLAIEIVGKSSGRAEIDADGDGVADDAEALEELGILPAELTALAERYAPGDSILRTQVRHFSSYQGEFPIVPPPSAAAPTVSIAHGRPLATTSVRNKARVESQASWHAVDLIGTPHQLYYQSDRTASFGAAYEIEVPLVGEDVPEGLERVRAEVRIAGQRLKKTLSPEENLSHTFQWDGRDSLGRLVQGQQRAKVIVKYDYPGEVRVSTLGGSGIGTARAIEGDDRKYSTLIQTVEIPVGAWDATGYEMGGFGVNVLHAYDPVHHTLHFGDGSAKYAENIAFVVDRPALGQDLGTPDSITIAPDGNAYMTDDSDGRILRVTLDEQVTVVAGPGADGRAADLPISDPQGIIYQNDGTILVADFNDSEVWRLAPSGQHQAIIGKSSVDPRVVATLDTIEGIAFGPSEELYLVTRDEVYRLKGDHLELFAGGGEETSEGAAAVDSLLGTPSGIAVAPDGTVYISEMRGHRVRKITPSGSILTVAGTGEAGFSGDGDFAQNAELDGPRGLALGADGTLYIADRNNHRIRIVTPDGRIQTIAGGGQSTEESGQVAREVAIEEPDGIAVANDGSIWVAAAEGLYRIRPGTPRIGAGQTLIPSQDGRTLYRFDARGKHLETIDAMTAVVLYKFEYNSAGLLNRITDRDGLVTRFRRSGGKLTSVEGHFTQETSVVVEGSRLASVTDPLGRIEKLEYDAETGLLETVEDARGKTSYAYNTTGRLISVTDPTGYRETYDREKVPGGHSVSVTTASEKSMKFIVSQLPGGTVERSIIGFDGQPKVMTDNIVTQTLHSPDGTQHFTALEADPHFGAQSVYAGIIETRTPGGRIHSVYPMRAKQVDDLENALSLSEWTDIVEVNERFYESTYNRQARTLTTKTPEGRVTTTHFDEAGRPVSRQNPGVAGQRWQYNNLGQTLLAGRGSESKGRDTTLSWGADGWVASFESPLGLTTGYTRDSAGRITEVLRPDSAAVLSAWDDSDNVLGITPPGRDTHAFGYTDSGLLEFTQPPQVDGENIGRISYAYNEDNQLISIQNADGRSIQFIYDGASRLDKMEFGSVLIDRDFDSAGRVVAATRTGGPRVARSYDGPLWTADTWSGTMQGSVAVTYDDNFWMNSLTVNSALTAHFSRDLDGLVTQARVLTNNLDITRSAESGLVTDTALSDVSTFIDYNTYGEPTYFGADTSQVSFHQSMTRDDLGRISHLTETVDGEAIEYSFSYDSLGQLIEYTKGEDVFKYTYDLNGNRTGYTADGVTVTSSFDAQDRIETSGEWTFSHTAQGDLLQRDNGTQALTLEYDELGNLLQADIAEGEDLLQIGYQVDAMGRRVARLIDGVFDRSWVYQDALRPVGEVDSNGVFTQYVYAEEGLGGAPDLMMRGGVAYRFIKDHVGSVRLVVNANTGAVMQELEYDPFGRVIFDSNPGFQPFGFAGGLHDWDTKLVRFGARDYDSEIGRWTAKDLIGFAGAQTNIYVYVGNDPVNGVDPRGLATFNIGTGYSAGSTLVSVVATAFGFSTPSWLTYSSGIFIDFSDEGVRVGVYRETGFGLGLSGPLGHAGVGLEAGLTDQFHNFVGESENKQFEAGRTGLSWDDHGAELEFGPGWGAYGGLTPTQTEAEGYLFNLSGAQYFYAR